MEQIWWQDEHHRQLFVRYVRSLSYWQDVDVEGDPEGFIKDYDYGLLFYVLAATGKGWSSRWVKVEREGDEEYEVLDGQKLLEDAGAWSSGERALVRLALHLFDHKSYPVTLYDALDDLSGSYAQVARVAIALKFRQAKEPFWAHQGHVDDYYRWCMLQHPHQKDPALRSVVYVLSALDKENAVYPCLVERVQTQPVIDPLHGSDREPVDVVTKTGGRMITATEDGLVTGAGRYDYRRLQTSPAWFSFTPGERALARLAAYLQAPNEQTNLTEILMELNETQLRVATDALRIRFGQKEAE